MKSAILAIELGMTERGAAREFNLNRSTLRLHRTKPATGFKTGGVRVLLPEEENNLKDWVLESLNRGYGLRSSQVIAKATKILRKRTGSADKMLSE